MLLTCVRYVAYAWFHFKLVLLYGKNPCFRADKNNEVWMIKNDCNVIILWMQIRIFWTWLVVLTILYSSKCILNLIILIVEVTLKTKLNIGDDLSAMNLGCIFLLLKLQYLFFIYLAAVVLVVMNWIYPPLTETPHPSDQNMGSP